MRNFDGNMLMQKNELKYLGVFIDAKLNWKSHILHLTSSVAQSVGVIYKIRHLLSKNLLKILYNALIKSKLSYAITLWASAYKSDLHKLNVLNNCAVRCITFANRHTNLSTLYKKHKILKLNELQHYELGKHMFKITTMKLLFYWLEITNLFVIGIIIIQGTQQKIIM